MEEKRNQKKKMKRMLTERGITLVALVVTIIILLILAGVTLNIALSENGLFKRARNATERYQIAEKEENNQLKELEKQLNKYEQNTGGIGSSEVVGNLKQYQGKYVDIGLDANENTDTTDDWEIFYATNDRIFLIAADYVPVTTLNSWGVLSGNGIAGYGTYGVYWPSYPTSFLELPTNPSNFLELVMHNGYNLNEHNSGIYYNSWAASQLLNTASWNGIKEASEKSDSIDFVIGGSTLEMWCAAWKEAIKDDTNGFVEIKPEGTNDNGYYVSSDQSGMQNKEYIYMNGTQSGLDRAKLSALSSTYKTFFPHAESSGFSDCIGYWLTSPSARGNLTLMFVRCNGSVDSGNVNYSGRGVRPLVSLASGVQLVEKKGTEDKYDVTK